MKEFFKFHLFFPFSDNIKNKEFQQFFFAAFSCAFFTNISLFLIISLFLFLLVRQENERLMQEQLSRSKMSKNFTHAAAMSASISAVYNIPWFFAKRENRWNEINLFWQPKKGENKFIKTLLNINHCVVEIIKIGIFFFLFCIRRNLLFWLIETLTTNKTQKYHK